MSPGIARLLSCRLPEREQSGYLEENPTGQSVCWVTAHIYRYAGEVGKWRVDSTSCTGFPMAINFNPNL